MLQIKTYPKRKLSTQIKLCFTIAIYFVCNKNTLADVDTITARSASQSIYLMQSRGYSGEFHVLSSDSVVSDHRYRLQDTKINLSTTATVSGGKITRYNKREKFLGWCAQQAGSFVLASGNSYWLELQVFPFSESLELSLTDGSELQIENRPTLVELPVHLTMEDTAFSRKYSRLSIKEYERILQEKIKSQWADALKTGRVTLQLTSMDEFICDLLSGKVQLDVESSFYYTSAQQSRYPLITPEQYTNIYNEVAKKTSHLQNIKRFREIFAFVLGQALEDEMQKSPERFGYDNFLTIIDQMLDSTQQSLRQLSRVDLYQLPQQLDRLEYHTERRTPLIRQNMMIKGE